jgi:hypothetical protein
LDRLIDHGGCATIERADIGRRRPPDSSVTTAPIGGAPYLHRWGYHDIRNPQSAIRNIRFVPNQPSSRSRRALTSRMRTALEVLRSAGAIELADDFLPAELKAAFRRLARTAHPDMHPRANEHDQRCLIARFREIRDAYYVLSTSSMS